MKESKFTGVVLPLAVLLGGRSVAVPQSRPPITGISHVVVWIDDLDVSNHFYADLIGWPATKAVEVGDAIHYQVGIDQYVEVKQAPAARDPADRLDHIAFKTSNVEAMRQYLATNGMTVPEKVEERADGSRSFMVTDPEGYKIEFVQGGRFRAPSAIAVSTHLLHVGFNVRDEVAETHFYKELLGSRLYWQGWTKDDSHKEGQYDFKSLQVPDGTDWVEFMLAQGKNAALGQPWRQDPHHFAPGVESVDVAYAALLQRGLSKAPGSKSKPQLGRNGRMLLNLFDPNGLRVELMNFKPSKDPCCAPYTGPHPVPER